MKRIKQGKVTVTIDGLAICCYNRTNKPAFWDVGFLREPNHKLTLTIGRASVNVNKATLIEIYPVKEPSPKEDDEYPGGCHDRGRVNRRGRKDESMRWALDLNNPDDVLQDDLELQKPASCHVTRLQIRGAVFRCAGLFPTEARKDMYRVPVGRDPNKLPPGERNTKYRLGKTSDLIAGDISSSVNIKVDGELVQSPVGLGYTIAFENMDFRADLQNEVSSALFKGDFHLYYDAIRNARQKYALWGPLKPGTLNFRTDCNAVWLSEAENIDVLFS